MLYSQVIQLEAWLKSMLKNEGFFRGLILSVPKKSFTKGGKKEGSSAQTLMVGESRVVVTPGPRWSVAPQTPCRLQQKSWLVYMKETGVKEEPQLMKLPWAILGRQHFRCQLISKKSNTSSQLPGHFPPLIQGKTRFSLKNKNFF